MTYALSNGLLCLPPSSNTQPRKPTPAIHAPLVLSFEAARRLHSIYDVLYARVAMDIHFLNTMMGADTGMGNADEFTGMLWRGWKNILEHDVVRVKSLHLGLFRSDYLLHAAGERLSLKQGELNTISSSFDPLLSVRLQCIEVFTSFALLNSSKLICIRHVLASTSYLIADNIPENSTTSGLAEGLAKVHDAYGI
ncbi:glutathione synthetase ATP-binding domain-like protein [Rhizopogon salebrosus TDB-379]|nr:glutathione synthetase ATP-binding domain-like protein [Rhizopogon salebrosus TDB-379]